MLNADKTPKIVSTFSRISEIQTFIATFGFSMTNTFKQIQTNLASNWCNGSWDSTTEISENILNKHVKALRP